MRQIKGVIIYMDMYEEKARFTELEFEDDDKPVLSSEEKADLQTIVSLMKMHNNPMWLNAVASELYKTGCLNDAIIGAVKATAFDYNYEPQEINDLAYQCKDGTLDYSYNDLLDISKMDWTKL